MFPPSLPFKLECLSSSPIQFLNSREGATFKIFKTFMNVTAFTKICSSPPSGKSRSGPSHQCSRQTGCVTKHGQEQGEEQSAGALVLPLAHEASLGDRQARGVRHRQVLARLPGERQGDKRFKCTIVEFKALHDFGEGVKGAGFLLKEMGIDRLAHPA